MIPIVYVGIISFFSSFSISNVITREYLRYTYEKEIYKEDYTKKSLVKFNKYVAFKEIPSIKEISSNSLNKLWYSSQDYEIFKKEYLLYNKYKSI
jgi:hypothetical protein